MMKLNVTKIKVSRKACLAVGLSGSLLLASMAIMSFSSAMPDARVPFVVSTKAASGGIVLPEGTPVTLEVTEDIASSKSQKGDIIVLFVLKPVVVNGKILVNAGRYAEGKVRNVRRAGVFGRPGKISFEAVNIEAVDGQRVDVQGPMVEYMGRDRRALAWVMSIGLMVVGFAVLGLVAPRLIALAIPLVFVGMAVKGTNVVIESKKIISVQVHHDVIIQE